jgi:hypothetical protein
MNSKTNFARHERAIRSGNKAALIAWWDAARECRDEHDGNAKQYALLASKVSADWKMNTIRVYVGELMFLMKQGHKVTEFKSLEHARETRSSYATKPAPVAKPRASVAYDALFATKEFKALPIKAQKALRLLAKGESFHSNLI